jgi:hypothetical protein
MGGGEEPMTRNAAQRRKDTAEGSAAQWALFEAPDTSFEAAAGDLDGVFLAGDELAPGECEAPWWLAEGFYPGDAEEEAAWRAGLPGDVRADYDDGPYTGDDEAFGAGFSHHDKGRRSGAGFAAGGVLDRLEPGPFLADMLAVATAATDGTNGYTRLGESELVGVLCGWRRLSSWSAAGEAAATATLAMRRAQQGVAPENRHLDEHVADELAAALTLTGVSAMRLLEVANGLRRLPEVYAALLAGQIDWAKACVFVDELAALDEAEARRLAALLLGAASGLTTGQLRRRLRLLVLADHPEAAEARKREARKDTRVEVWDEPSGNAALAGRQLESADVIAIDRQLNATAEWLQSQGADGAISELRAAVYTALLAGRDLATLLPDDPADPRADGPSGDGAASTGSRRDGDSGREARGDDARSGDADAGTGAGSATGGSGAGGSGAGGSGAGGSAAGGSADGGSGSGGSRDGGASSDADAGPDRANMSAARWPRLTGRINLTMPLSTWAGLEDNAGEAAGYGPQDAATCRDLADMTDAKTRWCLTLTDEHGRAVAHACARDGPPRGDPTIRWARKLRGTLDYFETGDCSHPRHSPAYHPPYRLAHLIRIRQPTCSFPGCRRAAARCDLDHTLPYDQGGMTCECNLAPLCRRHHRAKQAARWHLIQDQPGHLTWQLPHQRSYHTEPEPYQV